jgi:hypothetical protein
MTEGDPPVMRYLGDAAEDRDDREERLSTDGEMLGYLNNKNKLIPHVKRIWISLPHNDPQELAKSINRFVEDNFQRIKDRLGNAEDFTIEVKSTYDHLNSSIVYVGIVTYFERVEREGFVKVKRPFIDLQSCTGTYNGYSNKRSCLASDYPCILCDCTRDACFCT